MARAAGLFRLVHPFPSLLDGAVVAGAASVAGADPGTAIRLGLSMTALQASIGALNDLVDAPLDRGRKPRKPVPLGLVSPAAARVVVVAAAGAGLALAAPGGAAVVGLAILVLAIGYGYDLVARGTIVSWLPFALGIPLLPLYGWAGGPAPIPGWFAALLPMAALAGTAIAVANARADLERDLDAGTRTVSTALGIGRSWWVTQALWAGAGAIAIGTLVAVGGDQARLAGIVTALGGVLAGALLGRSADPARRELAWEIQALGAAAAVVIWLSAVA